MIKIDIKDDLKIEVDLSVADSVKLVNSLIENKYSVEVKLLITHLSTILEFYKLGLEPKFKIKPTLGRNLANLLVDIKEEN
jgi:hypothetical protein